MPNRDGTGPEGKGSRTGRAQGKCGGNTPTTTAPKKGLGLGPKNGQGRGLGRNQFNRK